jgi:hypothetical protein
MTPDVAESAGAILDFYGGVLGSAIGSRAYSTAGGEGPGSIMASTAGANFMRDILINMPQVAKIKLIDEIFLDPSLTAAFLSKPTTERGRLLQYKKIINLLAEKGFTAGLTIQPGVTRETAEQEDRGTDVPYIGFPGLPEDPEANKQQRLQRFRERNEKIRRENAPSSIPDQSFAPPPNLPPMPAETPTPPAVAQAPSGPANMQTFAQLFPEDTISKGMQQQAGIGSLFS